jgi:hypothetical protein
MAAALFILSLFLVFTISFKPISAYEGGDNFHVSTSTYCPVDIPAIAMSVGPNEITSVSYAGGVGQEETNSWGWQYNANTYSSSAYFSTYQFIVDPGDNSTTSGSSGYGTGYGVMLLGPSDHFANFPQTSNTAYYAGSANYITTITATVNSDDEITEAWA